MNFRRGAGGRRWVLATLLCGLALLILAPSALAVTADGAISGVVTKAEGGETLAGIEVCASEANETLTGQFVEQCAKSLAGGVYEIAGLPSGSYDVEFATPRASALDYVTQYYNDKPSFSEARAVPVYAGEVTPNVDAAMRAGGEIEGEVTQAASPYRGLANISVAIFQAGGTESPIAFTTTSGSGGYTVKGLAPGEYKVAFGAGYEDLNYVTQYYHDASSLASATPVPVLAGAVTPDIDASMQPGGEISGTVTDASTHAPLEDVDVVALGPGGEVEGEAITNASGQYTIEGLATGSYKVGFAAAHYTTQYYDGEPSLASAGSVSVIQASLTAGIDVALVPKAPADVAAPVASGTPAAGQTLSCTSGSWTGSPTPTYAYAWLRDGVAIVGATASTYVVQAADVGNGLTCKVTATNKNGSAAAVSNTLIVPVPIPAVTQPAPALSVTSAKLVVSAGSARVAIACANASCAGTLVLSERIAVKISTHGKGKPKLQTLVLGRGAYALAAGHRSTVVVRLTAAGKRALARSRHRKLSATLVASVTGGSAVSESVVLIQAPPARRPRKDKRR